MDTLCRRIFVFRHSTMIAALTWLTLLGPGHAAADGPSVAELLLVCERAFAHGNRGLDAAACEWYAVPCGCSSRVADTEAPRWCIPASEAIEDTIRKVVAELRHYPDPTAKVDPVVPEILARVYPCRLR